ncbi:hypothetical protein BC939DRAFT_215484 [Gamsiella multidivaricata]|uniref:uncharacterized protein n=1 Tax=Gamsiella multidivaricata TaxID=101098 RepID=UPI00222020D7|nr:uncharacterized protein BC939DRAFT_215484 [Gamsiella multidivaricata]KAI7820990.1 hypothetical protein BC939DRAFT_215484 [Gamsiella multidivaricata]
MLVIDLSDIPENTQTAEEKSQQLTPRSSMIRKAVASPVIGSDDTSREFPSYFTRRKQLKAEGPHREPSVFYQTIEIQFPAPIGTDNPMPFKSTTSMSPTASSSLPPILPRGDRSTQNTSNLSGRGGPTRTPSGPTVAHAPPLRQRDSYSSPQIVSNRPNLGQKRVSGSGQSLQAQAAAYNTTAARRPTNPGMPILRAKSNPGDLSGAGMKDRPYGLSSSHSAGGSQAIEKFMGLFTGKHRDHDSSSSKDSDSKDGKKDKKRDSFTDKQRKYKSQEVNPSHLQGFASSGRKGAPVHGTINENEERPYAQPPPPRPMQQSGTAPQRPPPPPPEGSLMDLLDPPQRIGYHSGQSTPSGGSRSNSPARAPSASRHPLPANTSFTSTSSARSTSSGDRLYHGRGLPSHGSSSSLEMLNPGLRPEDEHYARKRSPRPGHSPQVDSHGHVLYDNHLYHQQQHKQHLASHPHSRQQHQQQHGAHSPHPGYEYGGNNTAGYFQPPQMSSPALSPRSRQGSFGSVETYDSNAPTPTPKSKDRKLPREGSSPSILRDHHNGTPSKERSNSSKTSSPHHSPALGPLSRAASNQGGYGYTQQQQQQQHGSSPLAEGYGATSYGSLSPSSRARTRAQSRDEQHLLHRQESGSIAHAHAAPRPPYYERERSRSGTGLTISTMTSGLVLASAPVSAHSSPAMPPVPTTSSLSSVTHHHNSNNSSVSLASTSSTASRSLGPGRYAAPPPSG